MDNKRIVVLDVNTQTGALTWDAGNTLANNSPNIGGQQGIEINGNFLYATDYQDSNIDIYQIDPATGTITYDSSFGSHGDGVNQFLHPLDIDFFTTSGGQTKAYVPDANTQRLIVLDVNTATGALTWDQAHSDVAFNSPEIVGQSGLEVKDNLLYVTDRHGGNIDIYQIHLRL